AHPTLVKGSPCTLTAQAQLSLVDSAGRPLAVAGNPSTATISGRVGAGADATMDFRNQFFWSNWCGVRSPEPTLQVHLIEQGVSVTRTFSYPVCISQGQGSSLTLIPPRPLERPRQTSPPRPRSGKWRFTPLSSATRSGNSRRPHKARRTRCFSCRTSSSPWHPPPPRPTPTVSPLSASKGLSRRPCKKASPTPSPRFPFGSCPTPGLSPCRARQRNRTTFSGSDWSHQRVIRSRCMPATFSPALAEAVMRPSMPLRTPARRGLSLVRWASGKTHWAFAAERGGNGTCASHETVPRAPPDLDRRHPNRCNPHQLNSDV
ncbi:MAG: hypothetical protein QOJ93_181, partial [Actinomycetota bacterium]|nr:hypothetical protein [Actinomycetota bacterium]